MGNIFNKKGIYMSQYKQLFNSLLKWALSNQVSKSNINLIWKKRNKYLSKNEQTKREWIANLSFQVYLTLKHPFSFGIKPIYRTRKSL